jgi:hypothetical protein
MTKVVFLVIYLNNLPPNIRLSRTKPSKAIGNKDFQINYTIEWE